MHEDYAEASYDIKELARQMADPRESGLWCANHLVWYLKGNCDTLLRMRPDMGDVEVHAYVESDWAGCHKTAKSTDCVVSFVPGCLVTFSSKTQTTVAQSSAEAELGSHAPRSHQSVFLAGSWEDMSGERIKMQVCPDASAGCAIACRRGPGRVRHLNVRQLFV